MTLEELMGGRASGMNLLEIRLGSALLWPLTPAAVYCKPATVAAAGGAVAIPATVGRGEEGAEPITSVTFPSGLPAGLTGGTLADGAVSFTVAANARNTSARSFEVAVRVGSKSFKDVEGVMSVSQAADAYADSGGAYTYGNVTAGAIANATIPASGGSATATAGNGSQPWSRTAVVRTWTSGATDTVAAASSGTNAVAPSVASISGSAGSKGTAVSGVTTVKTQAVTWSANGKSASGTMYVYQAANAVTGSTTAGGVTTYGDITIPNDLLGYEIPASGGTITVDRFTGLIPWSKSATTRTDTYTSGSKNTVTTAAATSGTETVPAPASQTVSASSLGTTVKSLSLVKTLTFTWTAHGKSASQTVKVYQAENKVTKTETLYRTSSVSILASSSTTVVTPAAVQPQLGSVKVEFLYGPESYDEDTVKTYTSGSKETTTKRIAAGTGTITGMVTRAVIDDITTNVTCYLSGDAVFLSNKSVKQETVALVTTHQLSGTKTTGYTQTALHSVLVPGRDTGGLRPVEPGLEVVT